MTFCAFCRYGYSFPNFHCIFGVIEVLASKLASVVGKPMVTDKCTAKKLRVSYARVLVEVDITQPLRESVAVKDHLGHQFMQKIVYEWKPAYCAKCLKLGHDCAVAKPVQNPPKQGRKKQNTNVQWKAKPQEVGDNRGKAPQNMMVEPAPVGTSTVSTSVVAAPEAKELGSTSNTWNMVRGGSPSRSTANQRTGDNMTVGQVDLVCQNVFTPLRGGSRGWHL